MYTVETLIDEAVKACGGQSALARRLNMPRQDINTICQGKRPISPELVALLADVLELPGEETQRLAALAVVNNPKNSENRTRLYRAFFGCWVAGAVAFLTQTTLPADSFLDFFAGSRVNTPHIVAEL